MRCRHALNPTDYMHNFAEDKAAAQLEIWREANPAPRPTLEQVADHIDHIRWTAGIDHIGIGGDYDGMPRRRGWRTCRDTLHCWQNC